MRFAKSSPRKIIENFGDRRGAFADALLPAVAGFRQRGRTGKSQMPFSLPSDPANAAVNAAVADITQAEARVQQKEAAVTVAQTNLDYTIIRSSEGNLPCKAGNSP